jgi:hypothetical protein
MFSLRITVILAVVTSMAAFGGSAVGEVLHFEQLPLNGGLVPSSGGAAFPGHSELSTMTPAAIVGFSGTYMADDFSLITRDPIVQVEWWGSYLNAGSGGGVQRFLLSFETDVPATVDEASHPGTPVISQIVSIGALAPNSGTFTESAIPTGAGAAGQLYHYTANLEIPMLQIADAVNWLKIVAVVNPEDDGNIEWGWQNRDYAITDTLASTIPLPGEHTVANGLGLTMWHFQDDAVTGGITMFPIPQTNLAAVQQDGYAPQNYVDLTDGPAGIDQFGKDLAFRLHTMVPAPEPNTFILLGLGGVALVAVMRRRRRR